MGGIRRRRLQRRFSVLLLLLLLPALLTLLPLRRRLLLALPLRRGLLTLLPLLLLLLLLLRGRLLLPLLRRLLLPLRGGLRTLRLDGLLLLSLRAYLGPLLPFGARGLRRLRLDRRPAGALGRGPAGGPVGVFRLELGRAHHRGAGGRTGGGGRYLGRSLHPRPEDLHPVPLHSGAAAPLVRREVGQLVAGHRTAHRPLDAIDRHALVVDPVAAARAPFVAGWASLRGSRKLRSGTKM